MMYRLLANIDPITKQVLPPNMVLKDGRIWIPFSENNTDYAEYLKWLEQGNIPLPAEEQ